MRVNAAAATLLKAFGFLTETAARDPGDAGGPRPFPWPAPLPESGFCDTTVAAQSYDE